MLTRGRYTAALVVAATIAISFWLLWQTGTIDLTTNPREDKTTIADFDGLPYLSYVRDDPNPDKKGVILYNPRLSHPGLNLLTSRLVGGAHLLDVDGRIVHSWAPNDTTGPGWVYSEMDEAGNLLVLIEDVGLAQLDWDSRVIWVSRPAENPLLNHANKVAYHHDFAVAHNGDIYVLATEVRRVQRQTGTKRIRDNSIVVLTSDGVPVKKISLYDLLRDAIPESAFEEKKRKFPRLRSRLAGIEGLDVLHANTVEVLRREIPVGQRGDLLFCVRNLNLIGVLDIKEERVGWTWGPGVLDRPHQPTALDNGDILVFDNGTRTREYSRIIEMSPATGQIVWTYQTDPPNSFFSKLRGGNQRLPNGNTLITESDKGHVFEITPNGEIVWDFWNFETNEKGQRGIIYRMIRYDLDFLRR